MRVADVIMSFPSLLLAVVVLYVFSPSAANIVAVLAITRIPVYLRTARAESAELSSRVFVDAARTFGASPTSIIGRRARLRRAACMGGAVADDRAGVGPRVGRWAGTAA